MDDTKRKKLEAAGWKVGDADEFVADHEHKHKWDVHWIMKRHEHELENPLRCECDGRMGWNEILRRINEYEALKQWKERATNALEFAGKQGTMYDAEEWLDTIKALLTKESDNG